MRTRIPEAFRHEQVDGQIWGELEYVPDGRRSIYWVTRRARKGWSLCQWVRWVPKKFNRVRPAGYFSTGS